MKTILYINNKYCTKLNDFKSTLKKISDVNEGRDIKTQIIAAFRDGIIKEWITEMSKVDVAAKIYADKFADIRDEKTDTEIMNELYTIFGTSQEVMTMGLKFEEYLELMDECEVLLNDHCDKYSIAENLPIADDIHEFTLRLKFKVIKSAKDQLCVSINGETHNIPLHERLKIYTLTYIFKRDSNYSNQEICIKCNSQIIKSVEIVDGVDLGLDVKWASCNLGAKSPFEIGGYYAWSELQSKDRYDEGTFVGHRSIKNIAGLNSYDATTAKLGSKWRIPTKGQWQQLISQCDWKLEKSANILGFRVTSRRNQRSIFLPITGRYNGMKKVEANSGWYWSSIKDDVSDAFAMVCPKPNCPSSLPSPNTIFIHKYYGLCIRPVSKINDNK